MIRSRWMPSATPLDRWMPRESGPRCACRSHIASTRPLDTSPREDTLPAIPHIALTLGERHRVAGSARRDLEGVTEPQSGQGAIDGRLCHPTRTAARKRLVQPVAARDTVHASILSIASQGAKKLLRIHRLSADLQDLKAGSA